ncbi:MAG: PspC domain-containing protein [Crocinitomicaceae bacterium]|nr:PspC domain-containing protein [Crocinitomicaceae bacterium]
MNKTISINIAGFAFIIEEGAYHSLQNYLDAIKRNFQDDAEREEIMTDIESRIAEIFREKLTSDSREVVLLPDVDEVMNIMGRPEDYVTEETIIIEETSQQSEHQYQEERSDRKLYRDGENAMIGGVCSGLAHYFKMDPSLMRVLFVLFGILGGGVLIYIILLLVIPEAKTTSQKLAMKGQNITIDAIKDQVKDGAKNAQGNIKKNVDKVVGAGSNLLKSFSRILGFFFLIGGVGALFVFLLFFFSGAGVLPIVENGEPAGVTSFLGVVYPGEGGSSLLIITMLLVVILPIIGIIISGIKMVFRYTKSFRPYTISVLVLWILSAAYVGYSSVKLGMNFRNRAEVKTDIPIVNDSTDVLYVDVVEEDLLGENVSLENVWNFSELVTIDDKNITLGYPQLKILPAKDSENFEIQINKESCGYTIKDAVQKAERIDYEISITDNQVSIPPYFSVPKDDKIRAQYPSVIIRVPEGKRIVFGNSIDRINVDMVDNKYCYCGNGYRFAKTEWEGKGTTLHCNECEVKE